MELLSEKCSSVVLLCYQMLSLACVCFCLLLFSLSAFATEVGEVAGLEWQLSGQWQGVSKSFIHFKAKPTGSQHAMFQSAENDLFTGDITITGRVGQSFIVCAQQVITDDFFQIPPNAESDYLHSLLLKEITGELSIVNAGACPDGTTHPYFNRGSMVYSPEPFLAVRKESTRERSDNNDSPLALPSDPSLPEPMSLLTGSGFDGHNDFKRPPFMPPPDKTSFDLVLLPTFNLPANWREYLPFASLYHWFTSTENEGVTIIIRFDNQSPVTLSIRREELPELAEHLLSARRLLHWLAPRLNGREQLVEQLLKLSENAELQEMLSEEALGAIQKQLAIVLGLPDTEFYLDFEIHLLVGTLSGLSPLSPENGIIQLPIGKPGSKPRPLEEDNQPPPQKSFSLRQSGQGNGKGQENSGERSQSPGQPSGQPSTGNSEEEIAKDYFIIVVNDVRFYIKKEQLLPLQRGQEKASAIKVINPENPAGRLSLDEVESATDVPELFRLSRYDGRALDYLLTYGTRATQKALKQHYPVNLISGRDGHLVADANYQDFPVGAVCEICQEPLLSQQSLTHCDHPGKHTFHTSCLSQWLGRGESGTRCPYCHEELTEPLPALLAKELESELHHAVEVSNRNVLKALLETEVDVNAKNTDGNTPLWVASSHHQHDMVILLLDNNADVHQTGFEEMTVLDIAVLTAPRHPSPETTINLLLEKNVRLTERGARGIDDLIDPRLQQALMTRFRQGAQQQTFHGQTVNKAVEGSKVQPLHCLICNAMEHVTTVNGLPVCNDCLKLQSEQTDIYEHSRKPEQKDPQMDTITDRIYLGNYDFASDRERLQRSGITSILVCGSSLTQHFPNDFNYLQLPVEDKTEQDISGYFSMAWDFIENELSKSPDSKVFVHCHAGVSRSSAIVISYLMRKLKMRYDEAFSFVKEHRPCIYPNEAFVAQLRRYEKMLENKGL